MRTHIVMIKKWGLIATCHFILLFAFATHAQTNKNDEGQTTLSQIGFYDILAEKEEIYDLALQTTSPNTYDIELTMPKESRFILKAKITFPSLTKKYLNAEFVPVRYYNPLPDLMINSFVDYASHRNFLIKDVATAHNRHLYITRSGMLVLLPNLFPGDLKSKSNDNVIYSDR